MNMEIELDCPNDVAVFCIIIVFLVINIYV